jgi:hypothetical protein
MNDWMREKQRQLSVSFNQEPNRYGSLLGCTDMETENLRSTDPYGTALERSLTEGTLGANARRAYQPSK